VKEKYCCIEVKWNGVEQQQLYALKYNNERNFQTNDNSFDQNYFPLSEQEEE
jgi:hypothetical protein